MAEPNVIWLGFVASRVAGIGTSVGACGIFFIRRLSEALEDILLRGFVLMMFLDATLGGRVANGRDANLVGVSGSKPVI